MDEEPDPQGQVQYDSKTSQIFMTSKYTVEPVELK